MFSLTGYNPAYNGYLVSNIMHYFDLMKLDYICQNKNGSIGSEMYWFCSLTKSNITISGFNVCTLSFGFPNLRIDPEFAERDHEFFLSLYNLVRGDAISLTNIEVGDEDLEWVNEEGEVEAGRNVEDEDLAGEYEDEVEAEGNVEDEDLAGEYEDEVEAEGNVEDEDLAGEYEDEVEAEGNVEDEDLAGEYEDEVEASQSKKKTSAKKRNKTPTYFRTRARHKGDFDSTGLIKKKRSAKNKVSHSSLHFQNLLLTF
jgi:hypothetical protein